MVFFDLGDSASVGVVYVLGLLPTFCWVFANIQPTQRNRWYSLINAIPLFWYCSFWMILLPKVVVVVVYVLGFFGALSGGSRAFGFRGLGSEVWEVVAQ